MEIDADGDEVCHLLDTTTKDVHKVLFREKEAVEVPIDVGGNDSMLNAD
jgi:hypothetical protein